MGVGREVLTKAFYVSHSLLWLLVINTTTKEAASPFAVSYSTNHGHAFWKPYRPQISSWSLVTAWTMETIIALGGGSTGHGPQFGLWWQHWTQALTLSLAAPYTMDINMDSSGTRGHGHPHGLCLQHRTPSWPLVAVKPFEPGFLGALGVKPQIWLISKL